MGLVDGRVVVVTGAGRGIGRAHALAFAAEGARVVVNDIGAGLNGSAVGGPAREVAREIIAAGGEVVVSGADIADWDGARSLIETAVDRFGGLDVLVNTAGFVRGDVLVDTREGEWDAVVRVHLKGHFATLRHATQYWRGQSEAGEAVDARIITTSSEAGPQGTVGQGSDSAAKFGIAAFTVVGADELGRYGITVNAVAPTTRTRMIDTAFGQTTTHADDGFDAMAPGNVSSLVVWLGSAESGAVTGKVFEVDGARIRVAEAWAHGPQIDKGARWDPAELGPVVADLLARSRPAIPVYDASRKAAQPSGPRTGKRS